MTTRFNGFFVFFCIFFCRYSAYSDISAEELINKIQYNEKLIQNVRADFSIVLVEKNNYLEDTLSWGYEGGKEYFYGTTNYLPNEIYELEDCSRLKLQTIETVQIKTAFDGEKCFFYRKSSKEQNPERSRGVIGSLAPSVFSSKLTPNVLLGYDVKEFGRSSLSEAIVQSGSFTVQKEMETVHNRFCYVIELDSVEIDPGSGMPWDAKVWIDPERGFRPIRIEKYFGGVDGSNKYKILRQRTDILELRQVDGIWFPIRGQRSWYKVSEVIPPGGMSPKDFSRLPEEERRRIGIHTISKLPLTRMVTVDPNSIRINKGIREEEFRVQFPDGCAVFDEYLQSGYVVGRTGSLDIPKKTLSEPDSRKAVAPEADRRLSSGKNNGVPDSQPNIAPVKEEGKPSGSEVQSRRNDGISASILVSFLLLTFTIVLLLKQQSIRR